MENELTIYPLDYQAAFSVSGIDSETFLQGQLTCDLKEVSENGSRLAAHCNPKGAMLSLVRVVKMTAQTFLLRSNSAIFEQSMNNLKKYIIFSKAEITDLSDTWQGFGLSGTQADELIANTFNAVPQAIDESISIDNKVVVKVGDERYEIWIAKPEVQAWIEQQTLSNQFASSDLWRQQEIINAIPDIYPQTSAVYIPQMCNLQALQGVSFKKGCYTGQEVITRLHFRGKLTKFLLTAVIDNSCLSEPLTFNSEVFHQQTKAGKILQWVDIGEKTYIQLIVNQKLAAQALTLQGSTLTVLTLPYTLDPNLFIRKV